MRVTLSRMNKKILRIAKKKFQVLAKQYSQFNVVFLDNWHGFRFVYDVEELKKYHGKNFYKSRFYKLLKNEKPAIFTANLYKASRADKKLYGPNPFLNCKTYREYYNAYAVYLLKKTNNKRQVIKELKLIKNLRVIYSKNGDERNLERKFRRLLIQKVLRLASQHKRSIIRDYVNKNKRYFS